LKGFQYFFDEVLSLSRQPFYSRHNGVEYELLDKIPRRDYCKYNICNYFLNTSLPILLRIISDKECNAYDLVRVP